MALLGIFFYVYLELKLTAVNFFLAALGEHSDSGHCPPLALYCEAEAGLNVPLKKSSRLPLPVNNVCDPPIHPSASVAAEVSIAQLYMTAFANFHDLHS